MDTIEKVSIRTAGPQDASFLARIILIAGRAHLERGFWEILLGENEAKSLRFLELLAGTEGVHLYHYSCFLIAESDGVKAAALAGYDPVVLGTHALWRALPEVISKMGIDPSAGKQETGISACIPEDLHNAWIIHSVATLPEFRRKGIGDMLLREMIEKSRENGYSRAQINLVIGNQAARRMYEKYGFKPEQIKLDSRFEKAIGSPGMMSLVADIESWPLKSA